MLLANKEGSGEGSQAWDEAGSPFCLCLGAGVGPQNWELGGTQPGSGRTPQPWEEVAEVQTVQHHNPVIQSFYWLTTCLATGHCKRRGCCHHPYTFPKGHVVQEDFRQLTKPACVNPTPAPGLGPSITTSEDYNPCLPGRISLTSSSSSSSFFF